MPIKMPLKWLVNETVLLFDWSPSLHHAEPGTEGSTECTLCFMPGFEEFLPRSAHISKATTVIGPI